jgi:hypothetical protein
MVSGIDLLAHNQESLEKELAEKLSHIDEVTHVYYLAYKAGLDVQKELEEAVEMFSKAVKAMDKLCPALEYVVLQIGTKVCKTCPIPANVLDIVELTYVRWRSSPRRAPLVRRSRSTRNYRSQTPATSTQRILSPYT